MGSYCCTDDVSLGVKHEEYYLEIENKTISFPKQNPVFIQSRLETVKEEPNEYSEQSEYSKASRR
jgi:hypothetical protein